MSLTDFSVAEVQEFIGEALKDQGSALVRSNLKKTFARQNVDGKTLISLTRHRAQREYRMGAYGIPKGMRAALVDAVQNSLSKSAAKKATKGRGKPKFIGKRTVKTPDNNTVRDSPLAIARHMAKLDKRNKKTFDKNGWPKIEMIVKPNTSEELKAFKKSGSVPQIVCGFRKMKPEQVAQFVKDRLGNSVTIRNMASSIIRYKLTGDALATICLDKSSKRRNYSFSAYRIRSTAAKKLTEVVRSSLDTNDMAKPAKKSSNIRCPDGACVRDSSVAIAKYMATRYGSDGKASSRTIDESIPWDGTIVEPKSVRRAKEISAAGSQAPSLSKASSEEVGAWAIAKIGGRNGARLAKVLRASKMTGAQLVSLGGARKLTRTFNAMGVAHSLRKSLAKALRAEAKSAPAEAKPEVKSQMTLKGRGFTKMGDKKIRDSHVAIARYVAVMVEKKAPFKEGFPTFEWVSGGYQPVIAKSVEELGLWINKEFSDHMNKDVLVRNLKKYKVDGEALARICSKSAGVGGRLTAVGVPFSIRAALVKAVRKATPDYREPERKTKMIVCPDGKKVRDSTVAIAKHLRWQRRGYTPRDETEWPEIEIVALEPPAQRRRKVLKLSKAEKAKRAEKLSKKSGIPKTKKRQHKLDSHGWPAIDLVVSKEQNERKVEFKELGTQDLEMWMREKLGRHVGVKVATACIKRNKVTAVALAALATDKKHRNGRMAAMGVPYTLRKPLVQAIKDQEGVGADESNKTSWVGMNMITLPDGKTQIRDSALSIGRHYAKSTTKKEEATKLSANGWPNIKFVTAEDVESEKTASHGDVLHMRPRALSRWAEDTFKCEPERKRLSKAIKKYNITGRIIADVAHDYRKQSWRLAMYAVPFSLRRSVVRNVLSETKDYTVPTARKTIAMDGYKIRNSKIAMIMHMSKMQKMRGEGSVVHAPAEMQPDLLMMDVEEFAAWAGRKLRYAQGYHSALPAALIRNRVNGKLFAELAVKKGNRNARMISYGVPRSLRAAFMELAKRSTPLAASDLLKKRPFVGLSKIKLPTGKVVRDSAVSIRRSMERGQKNLKKSFDKNGWPKIEMVEAPKAEEVSPSKVTNTVPDKSNGFVIVGRSLLPGVASDEGLLAGLPDDLRKFSVEEVSRWTEAKMEDRNLARQFIRNRVSGLTLASIRDSKRDIVGRLNMLGVPKKLRAKFVRAVRRDAKPLVAKPNPAKYWYSPTGIRVRNSMVAIAAHVYRTTGRVIDQNRSADVLDFKQMSSQATASWTRYALSQEASGRSAARSLGRLHVSGQRLSLIVGEPKGRNDRLSAYGVPYSARLPLVNAVKNAVPDRSEPAKKTTVTAPDGLTIRDSTISMARWDSRQRKVKVAQPELDIHQPTSAPVIAMRNDEVIAFLLNSREISEHPLRNVLAKRLKIMRVDGDMLAALAHKGCSARAMMNVIGVPFSLMKQIVWNTRRRIATDNFCDVYKEAAARKFKRARSIEETQYKGFSKIKVEGKMVRDSAAAIASYLGRKHKITFAHDVEIVHKEDSFEMVQKDEKKGDAEQLRLEQLPAEKLGEWLSSNEKLSHLNQRSITDLVSALKRMKVSGRTLAQVCLKTNGRSHTLASYGIRKNVRKCLVDAVKEAMKDKKTGYSVIPSDGTDAPAKREQSDLIKAFRKAKASAKKVMGWPDIELMHKAPAAKGGYQIVKSLLPRLGQQSEATSTM